MGPISTRFMHPHSPLCLRPSRRPPHSCTQSAVSSVNEAMIKKTFAAWEPILNVVIPSSRFNGVSPGPQQVQPKEIEDRMFCPNRAF